MAGARYRPGVAAPSPPSELPGLPAQGRVFRAARLVRLGDVDPSSRLRLDAAARYLQDVSSDDTADVDPDARLLWVVRRTTLEVLDPPRYREQVRLATWCSGLGSRWAERRVRMEGERGGRVEASSLWVSVDRETGRPARLPATFGERYGVDPDTPEVGARHRIPAPPDDLHTTPWPIRRTDLDALDHVNNAAYWSVVEELRARRGAPKPTVRATIEYGAGIDPGEHVEVGAIDAEDGDVLCWLLVDGSVRAAARVGPLGTDGGS